MSAKAVAITFAPRSCPSWPILTTKSAGGGPLLQQTLQYFSGSLRTLHRPHRPRHRRPRVSLPRHGGGQSSSSIAMLISPTVARARAASTAASKRLPPSFVRVSARSKPPCTGRFVTAGADALKTFHLIFAAQPRCQHQECRSRSSLPRRYLFTPTITSCPGRSSPAGAQHFPQSAALACRWRPLWSCRPSLRLLPSGPGLVASSAVRLST